MYTKFIPSLFLLLFITFISCDKNEESDIFLECIVLDLNFFDSCYNYAPFNQADEIIITNQESYLAIADSLMKNRNSTTCTTNQLPDINFNDYFLIGKHTYMGACNAETQRDIKREEKNNAINYYIHHEYLSICSARFSIMNWTLIPRKYINYSINFEVHYNNINPD